MDYNKKKRQYSKLAYSTVVQYNINVALNNDNSYHSL